jgi:nitrate/nitrite-specific signal transduction histidine kinase
MGFALMLSVSGVAVYVFSHVVFGIIDRLDQRVLAQNRELSAVSNIATALSQPLGLEHALQVSLDTTMEAMGAPAGVICILDPEREELLSAAHRGLSPAIVERVRRQKLGDDPIGSEVVRSGRPVVIADAFNDPRVAELCRREGFRSTISVPVKSEGAVVGILALASCDEAAFGEATTQLLERIGQQVGIAVEKAILFRQLVSRNRDLMALNEISAAVSSTLDLAGIMATALNHVLELSAARSGEIWLVEQERSHLTLAAFCEPGREPSRELGLRVPTGQGLCGRVALSGEPAFEPVETADPDACLQVGVPLKSAGEIVGVMCIYPRQRQTLLAREQELLKSIAAQVGVAIKNAQLYRRIQDVAILEERDRIAREMHDGFAQVLGYVNTKASAVRRLLTAGRTEEAGDLVAQLEEAARQVYADVREAILGLRTTTQGHRHLVPQIEEYLEVFERLADVKVRCRLEDGVADVRLPVSAEIQVLRIIQEALSNVRKHAGATEVTVQLDATDGCLRVVVADDGRGFDPAGYERGDWPQFGLHTMRERAEAVGGRFQLHSAHGRGTEVVVFIPLNGAEGRGQ